MLFLIQKKKMQMTDKAVSVEGGQENNNDIKIREPPASFRSGICKHFGFWINVHDGKEVVEKENTVCKLCHNDMLIISYRKYVVWNSKVICKLISFINYYFWEKKLIIKCMLLSLLCLFWHQVFGYWWHHGVQNSST